MLKRLSSRALSVLFLFSASASAEPVRSIVVFKPEVAAADRLRLAQATGGRVVRTLELINAVVIEAEPRAMLIGEGMLRASASVARIDPDPKINWLLNAEPAGFHAVPLLPPTPLPRFIPSRLRRAAAPAGQEIPWGITRVNAPAAWSVTRGEGVKVAVIDTGIDPTHPNLRANLKGGWNAVNKDRPDDFKDDNGHGSHCAGTIAAVDDQPGVVGVAPRASLYGVKVLDAGGSGTFDDVIAGMQWAVEHKMQIASMSLGADVGNDSLKAAVEAMAKAGVVLIAAAGNSGGDVGFPAAYEGAIAVAAMDAKEHVAWFSSRGPQVAVIAPGVDVKSTYKDGGYETLDGTSMATPHVSGLAALAVAAKGLSGHAQLRAALTAAATPIPGLPATQQGAGVIDAAKLVR
jgi:subtilisin family serine protease